MGKARKQLGRFLLLNLLQGNINMSCVDQILRLERVSKRAGRIERKVSG
ncbi:MAG: hypothetical protein ACYDG6_06855 [Thermincolia bacterium]